MLRFFVIALGGALETVARYLVGGLDYRRPGRSNTATSNSCRFAA